MSRLLFQSSHDLHQLKKALLLLRASITLHRHYRSMQFSIIMAVLGAPVFPHGNLAFFVAIFSEMTRLSAGAGLRLHSIHPSITRESKWRYIMKKINLRELYPDVYTTDFFVDVTEEVMNGDYSGS